MTMLYKGNPFIHGWMKYVVIVGISTSFQLCQLTLFQVVFNYNSNFEFPTNTLPPLLYVIPSIHPYACFLVTKVQCESRLHQYQKNDVKHHPNSIEIIQKNSFKYLAHTKSLNFKIVCAY
jgi:hypothetical protein